MDFRKNYIINNNTQFEKLFLNTFEENFEDFYRCESLWENVELSEIEKVFASAYRVAVDMMDEEKMEYCQLDNIKKLLENGNVVWSPYAIYRIKTTDDKCPICGASFPHNQLAISRRDNKTAICSTCALQEAIEDMILHDED